MIQYTRPSNNKSEGIVPIRFTLSSQVWTRSRIKGSHMEIPQVFNRDLPRFRIRHRSEGVLAVRITNPSTKIYMSSTPRTTTIPNRVPSLPRHSQRSEVTTNERTHASDGPTRDHPPQHTIPRGIIYIHTPAPTSTNRVEQEPHRQRCPIIQRPRQNHTMRF